MSLLQNILCCLHLSVHLLLIFTRLDYCNTTINFMSTTSCYYFKQLKLCTISGLLFVLCTTILCIHFKLTILTYTEQAEPFSCHSVNHHWQHFAAVHVTLLNCNHFFDQHLLDGLLFLVHVLALPGVHSQLASVSICNSVFL